MDISRGKPSARSRFAIQPVALLAAVLLAPARVASAQLKGHYIPSFTGLENGTQAPPSLSLAKSLYEKVEGSPVPRITSFGLVYYGQFKVTADEGTGPISNRLLAGRKDRVFGVGLEGSVYLPGSRTLLGLRIVPEFGARNRTQGVTFLIPRVVQGIPAEPASCVVHDRSGNGEAKTGLCTITMNYDLLSQASVRAKGEVHQVIYWSRLPDWKIQTLAPNPDTIYLTPDLKNKSFTVTAEAGIPSTGAEGMIFTQGGITAGWG
jgi:hypothetical protein